MKKLLLSMVITLMTLTATLYAACTADVDMGSNKITNLAAGTANGDAVNYEQTLVRTTHDIIENNASLLTSYNTNNNVQIDKMGNLCIITGMVTNVSGSDLTTQVNFGNIPAGFRPYQNVSIAENSVTASSTAKRFAYITPTGDIWVLQQSNPWPSGTGYGINASFFCR